MLGIDLLEAQPAKVPITFYPSEGLSGDIFVPAGTQVAADGTEEHDVVTFETMEGFSVINSSIVGIYSVDPKEDAIYDHSTDLKEGRSFTIFNGENVQKHALYLGHSDLFKINSNTKIKIIFIFNKKITQENLENNQTVLKHCTWNYWNGKTRETFAAGDPVIDIIKRKISVELTRGGEIKEEEVNGLSSLWIEMRTQSIDNLLPSIEDNEGLKSITGIKVNVDTASTDLVPDAGFYNSFPLDVAEEFYPFGTQPRIFDTFHLASREAFSKKGAKVTMAFTFTITISSLPTAIISWEYWNGTQWRPLSINYLFSWEEISEPDNVRLKEILEQKFKIEWIETAQIQRTDDDRTINASAAGNSLSLKLNESKTEVILKIDNVRTFKFMAKQEDKKLNIYDKYDTTFPATLAFEVPEDFEACDINGASNFWIRARLMNNGYGGDKYSEDADKKWTTTYNPPLISRSGVHISYTLAEADLQHCVTHNNLEYEDITEKIGSTGGFDIFQPLLKNEYAIYLGFEEPLNDGSYSAFFSVSSSSSADRKADLSWQYLTEDPPITRTRLKSCFKPEIIRNLSRGAILSSSWDPLVKRLSINSASIATGSRAC